MKEQALFEQTLPPDLPSNLPANLPASQAGIQLLRSSLFILSGLFLAGGLLTLGFFLGGKIPAPAESDNSPKMLISDTIILEPEEKVIELRMDSQIPRMDIQVDTNLDITPPPLAFSYSINPQIKVGVAVPAPPAMSAAPAMSGLGSGNMIFGVDQLEVQPRPVHAPPPRYPRQAQQMRREGTVKVRVVLDENGNIVSARLMPGADVKLFGQATLEAVKKWRFSPGKIGNRAVRCEVEIPVEFSLSR